MLATDTVGALVLGHLHCPDHGCTWDDGEWRGAETEEPWPLMPSALRDDSTGWGKVWIDR